MLEETKRGGNYVAKLDKLAKLACVYIAVVTHRVTLTRDGLLSTGKTCSSAVLLNIKPCIYFLNVLFNSS